MGELVIPVAGGQQMSTYEEMYREVLDDRTIVFNDEVTDAMVEDVVLYILKWNKEDMHLPVESRKPIKTYMSSVGGDTFVSQNVVDVIVASKTPVIGIGLSLVASASYHIFLACHDRICFKNSIFLQHDGSVSISNSTKKVKDTMEFFNLGEQRTKDFVLSHTKMTEEFYDQHFDTELYMYADRAKELGIVDKIIGEDVELEDVI